MEICRLSYFLPWSWKWRSDVVIGFDQFNVRDAECLSQFVKGNHGRVPSTAFRDR